QAIIDVSDIDELVVRVNHLVKYVEVEKPAKSKDIVNTQILMVDYVIKQVEKEFTVLDYKVALSEQLLISVFELGDKASIDDVRIIDEGNKQMRKQMGELLQALTDIRTQLTGILDQLGTESDQGQD